MRVPKNIIIIIAIYIVIADVFCPRTRIVNVSKSVRLDKPRVPWYII